MFEIVDYRYEWCETYSWLIICMKLRPSQQHFYVKHMITSTEQAEKWLDFWRAYLTDVSIDVYQYPN